MQIERIVKKAILPQCRRFPGRKSSGASSGYAPSDRAITFRRWRCILENTARQIILACLRSRGRGSVADPT